MGSSSYLGGSSIINTRWSWSGKSSLSKPKRKTKTNKKIENLNKSINAWRKKKNNKSIHGKTGVDKYEGDIKDLVLLNASRRKLIRKIYKSTNTNTNTNTNTKNIHLSRQERIRFIDEIKQKGGLDNWAKSQTQYDYEVKKMKKQHKVYG